MTIFTKMLAAERVIIFPAPGDDSKSVPGKNAVIQSLASLLSKGWEGVSAEQLEALVLKREATLTTRLSPLLAVPHAALPGKKESRMAAAVISGGLEWDSDVEHPVKLVFMMAGSRDEHLALLSKLAAMLQDEELQERLSESQNPEQFLSLFRRREQGPAAPFHHGTRDLSEAVFNEALRLKESIKGSRLILHSDAMEDGEYIAKLINDTDVLVVTSNEDRFSTNFINEHKPVLMPFKGLRRSAHVQFTLLYLMGKGLISRDDLIVNVYGKPGSGFFDSIRMSHLKRELDMTLNSDAGSFPEDLDLSTFARVLQLASELAIEGREGKPVGTLFVIGDYAGVRPYTRQMIINPFHGYSDEERNILDPAYEETVKEYAKIDGAFIINGNGTIESAGTFLSGQPTAEEMQSGLGARHAAAQGITAVSSAIAVAISESTRKVTVFQSGRRVMEL